ncbi:MAG: hypothetical protein AAF449_21290, partial [Myxococcota bacterium]
RALDPQDKAVRRELADIEANLKKSMDLILVVAPVQRIDGLSAEACPGFEAMFREALQTLLSEQASLGVYVLSPAWTKLFETKDDRAPDVNGGLNVELKACRADSGSGEVTFDWKILTPQPGALVVEGRSVAELSRGLILQDEQDAAAQNAMRKLSRRATRGLVEKLEASRSKLDEWLFVLAEYGMKQDDPTVAAEAFARIRQKGLGRFDADRLATVERYLDRKID